MADRERPSFEQVYSDNKRRIFGLALRLLGDPADAEDAAQEVFMKAYRTYGGFRNESAVSSWLYRIAMNHCLERIRASKRMKRSAVNEVRLDDDERRVQVADRREEGPLARVVREETRARISSAIEALPDRYRRAVILRDVEQMTYEEVSRILKISVEAVGVRLFRGRGLLRKALS